MRELSSHDPLNGNFDGGSYGRGALPRVLSIVAHPLTYLRREAGGYVLLDQDGPGCLTRLWMTAADGGFFERSLTLGDATGFGRLQLFFDGRGSPSVDRPAAQFFAGLDRRFPKPLVNDWRSSGGGNYSYVPFCFARHLKIRVTSVPNDDRGYYQLTLLSAPAGTPTVTFGDQRVRATRLLDQSAVPPRVAAAVTSFRRMRAGQTAAMARLRGSGEIRYLRLRVTPFDESTLQALALRITVNGAHRPQIDVPLGSLFGDGLQTRLIASRGFGMNPAASAGYLALPIPFRNGASIAVQATAPATLRLDAWRAGPIRNAGTLYGERHIERSRLGRDYEVLNDTGSGRLASLVDEILDGGSNAGSVVPLGTPDQQYMEGDDRVYVDGSRSPAIYGTGTEDLFNGGWYFSTGAFALAMSGAGPLGLDANGHGARSMYRVFADDGVSWGSQIRFGVQHGGGDDRVGELVAVTTFSYRSARTVSPTDAIRFGDRSSLAAHQFAGRVSHRRVRSYFEGEFNGNGYRAADPLGTVYQPALPVASSESLTQTGISYASSISFVVRIAPRNVGVGLRVLLDQSSVVPVEVAVDGRPVAWWTANATANPAKRWLETDFGLPPELTVGRRQIRITLTPQRGLIANIFELRALSQHAPVGQ